MARRVPVVVAPVRDPEMPQHSRAGRSGGRVRQEVGRVQRERHRHGDNARCRRAAGAVDSCFEAAVDLVDDGVMRRA